jgi:hypothetical protein
MVTRWLAGLVLAGIASAQTFRAGAATSNITPPLGAGIVGGWGAPPATHIHDELHVRCLVLDDGSSKLVFAVVDSVSVNREVLDEAKRSIQASTGIPVDHMMMSATHTHSASSARGANAMVVGAPFDDYQKFLIRRIADGVLRAVKNLEPARIAWGTGRVPQHVFNRRWLLKDGKKAPNPFGGEDIAVMNPGRYRGELLKPAGPVNPEVYFLSLESVSGRPIAVLANYWLHYVGGVGGGHISADYFGAFADRIQQLLGADRQDPPFVGILANGPCGDVNNIDYASTSPAPRYKPYEKMRIVANDVAQEVVRVRKTAAHRDWVPLKAAAAELALAMRKPAPDILERAKGILSKPPPEPDPLHTAIYARRTLDAANWPPTVNIVLQAFRIGDVGIAAIPFETFTETGLEIKARSPLASTFTIELANGGLGYLPTPEQHDLGGYETWLGTNRVEREASRKIVARLMDLFGQIK